MWGWHSQQHQAPQPDGQTSAQVAAQQPSHPGQTGPGAQPELCDMLQMLQDQGGSGLEDLNMFNTNF
jgi:hypothetical protein